MKAFKCKRLLAILLAMAMLFSLAACNSENDDEDSGKKKNAGKVTVTPKPPVSDPSTNANQNSTASNGFNTSATIQETLLYNESGYSITAKSLTYEDDKAIIEFAFENTTSQDVEFYVDLSSTHLFAVNQLILTEDGFMICEVNAGKKATDTLELDLNKLMLFGITAISTIEIDFAIMTENDSNYTGALKIETNTIAAGDPPSAEQLANAMKNSDYDFKHFSRETLYSKNGINILSWSIAESDWDEETYLLLEVENTTANDLIFQTEDFNLNGLYHMGEGSYIEIPAGYKVLEEINLSFWTPPEIWDLCGITDIGTITMDIAIGSATSYSRNYDTISMSVPNVTGTYDASGTELYADGKTRIILKGIIDEDSEYSNNIYIVLIAESNWEDPLFISYNNDKMAVNEYMLEASFTSMQFMPGKHSMIVLNLYDFDLDNTGITRAADIQSFSYDLEIRTSDYNTVSEFRVEYNAAS